MRKLPRMKKRSAYQHVVRRLLAARRPEKRPTAECLEENLRWLLHVTLPPVTAPETLRQRMRAVINAHRAWQREQWPHPEELSRWPALTGVLREPERLILALLLTADLGQVAGDALLRAEAQRVMQQMLEGLPELLREALLLQVTQGLSVPEIACVLGCSEGEVYFWLRQARGSILREAESGFGSNGGN